MPKDVFTNDFLFENKVRSDFLRLRLKTSLLLISYETRFEDRASDAKLVFRSIVVGPVDRYTDVTTFEYKRFLLALESALPLRG